MGEEDEESVEAEVGAVLMAEEAHDAHVIALMVHGYIESMGKG